MGISVRAVCGRLRFAAMMASATSTSAFAQNNAPPAADSGDTAWLITASALVLFMTLPGLALFYGGLVRAKNFLSVLMQCFAITAIASIIWVAGGYALAFGTSNGFIGSLTDAGAALDANVRAGTTVPGSVFGLFQMTFAIITPALFIGAFVERVRFGWLMLFCTAWILIVYIPVAHWVWGGGWLAELGTMDFAGGIVVHTTAGATALIVALLMGPRTGFPQHLMLPHSPALTLAGAGMLWVGWFGFNGGSALTASAAAGSAILATHTAASVAALTWIGLERWKVGKPTTVGIATGAIAGLATVTPAAGYVGIGGAMVLGLLGSAVCFMAVQLVRFRWRIDDSLDVFAVHGVGGMLGSILAAPLMASSLGGVGFAAGRNAFDQLAAQTTGVVVVAAWSIAASYLLAKGLAYIVPMRVSIDAEREGLDITSHGERAWEMD